MIRAAALLFSAVLAAAPAAALAAALAAAPADLAAARQRLAAAARAAGLGLPLTAPELRVFKAGHRVELWAAGRRVASYPAGLGHRGLADKRREGDHLTPEGRFRICSRNARSAFHLFLGISYPGPDAAERGLREGRIGSAQHAAILRATRRGGCPPWDTALGGAVGLHGGGSGSDWTWGCIALEDAAIEELWLASPVGTPVDIRP